MLGSLYDYNARFYSPALGRFLSPDTIVPSPGNPSHGDFLRSQSLNRYAYVLNNPLRYTDPTGHAWREDDSGGAWYPYRPCLSIVCLPTPTPRPTARPLIIAPPTPTGSVLRAAPSYAADDGWILRYRVRGDVDPRFEYVHLSSCQNRGLLPVSGCAEYRSVTVFDEGTVRAFDEPVVSGALGALFNVGAEWTPTGGVQPTIGVEFAGAGAQLQANQIMVGVVNPAGVGGGRVGAEYSVPMVVALATSQATVVGAGGAQKLGVRVLSPNTVYEWGIHIPGTTINGVWVSGAQRAYAWARYAPVRVVP